MVEFTAEAQEIIGEKEVTICSHCGALHWKDAKHLLRIKGEDYCPFGTAHCGYDYRCQCEKCKLPIPALRS